MSTAIDLSVIPTEAFSNVAEETVTRFLRKLGKELIARGYVTTEGRIRWTCDGEERRKALRVCTDFVMQLDQSLEGIAGKVYRALREETESEGGPCYHRPKKWR